MLLSEDEPGLEQLLQDVRRTGDLAAALEKAGSFPTYFLRMVHLGQETGRLEDTMEALSRHYRRELELRCFPETVKNLQISLSKLAATDTACGAAMMMREKLLLEK